MALLFRRTSLVTQVADLLRAEVLRGAWSEWIPSERELSTALHISRNSCRGALGVLRREGLIRPVRGRGARVSPNLDQAGRSSAKRIRSVGVIAPQPLGLMRPRQSLFLDEVRDELFDMGVRIQLHHSPAVYAQHPHRALRKLIETTPHDCWILLLSNDPLQRWFMREGLPCVVAGSVYPGITLPSVDEDYRAACRHAVGRLITLGHRRIAFLNRKSRAAGDLEGEAGFFEGLRPGISSQIVYHDEQRETVARLVRKLFSSPNPPTGLLVANSFCYLSVVTTLAGMRIRIPDEVSLISRDDDPFLAHIIPEPARYLHDPVQFGRKVMLLLRPLLEGDKVRNAPHRLLPRFAEGRSCRAIS